LFLEIGQNWWSQVKAKRKIDKTLNMYLQKKLKQFYSV
jgi:hypothetical protein